MIRFWIRHFWKIIVLFWLPCIRGGSEAGIADAERDGRERIAMVYFVTKLALGCDSTELCVTTRSEAPQYHEYVFWVKFEEAKDYWIGRKIHIDSKRTFVEG